METNNILLIILFLSLAGNLIQYAFLVVRGKAIKKLLLEKDCLMRTKLALKTLVLVGTSAYLKGKSKVEKSENINQNS